MPGTTRRGPERGNETGNEKGNQVQKDDISSGQDGGRAKGEASPATAGGLDLSLGHIGTQPLPARLSGPLEFTQPGTEPVDYLAVCDACHFTMNEAAYLAAEKLAGPCDDPKCPGCGRRAWTFF